MIFQQYVDSKWGAALPPLLVALKGDIELYREALECYYKKHWFALRHNNYNQVESMSAKKDATIYNLEVQ